MSIMLNGQPVEGDEDEWFEDEDTGYEEEPVLKVRKRDDWRSAISRGTLDDLHEEDELY